MVLSSKDEWSHFSVMPLIILASCQHNLKFINTFNKNRKANNLMCKVTVFSFILVCSTLSSFSHATSITERCEQTYNDTLFALKEKISEYESKGFQPPSGIVSAYNSLLSRPDQSKEVQLTYSGDISNGVQNFSLWGPNNKISSDYHHACRQEVLARKCPGGFIYNAVTQCKILANNTEYQSHQTNDNQEHKIVDIPIGQDKLLARANNGDAEAQFSIGKMYDEGENVTQNKRVAIEWYNKSATQGNKDALFCLASMYDKGDGVAFDSGKALEYYEKAALQGHIVAQYNLGIMFDTGLGASKDIKNAIKWYTMAAKQGDNDARKKLNEICKHYKQDCEKSE